MRGYHYSTLVFEPGTIITSVQSVGETYKIVHGKYKEVANELGIYFPDNYGYAYKNIRTNSHFVSAPNEVFAPDDKVTEGNLNHSVLYVMYHLRSFIPRGIPLEDRLCERNIVLRVEAKRYFTKLDRDDEIELISDVWTVV